MKDPHDHLTSEIPDFTRDQGGGLRDIKPLRREDRLAHRKSINKKSVQKYRNRLANPTDGQSKKSQWNIIVALDTKNWCKKRAKEEDKTAGEIVEEAILLLRQQVELVSS